MSTLHNGAPGAPSLVRRFLRIRQVEDLVGKRKSSIYADIAKGSFPAPVPLGDARNSPVVWPEDEIAAWQAKQLARRDAAKGPGGRR